MQAVTLVKGEEEYKLRNLGWTRKARQTVGPGYKGVTFAS